MITSLEIQRYRNLTNVEIETLSRVNLIIGKNNTGKTNLLESINFYASQKQINEMEVVVVDEEAPDLLTEDEILIPENIKFVKSNSSIHGFLTERTFDSFSQVTSERALSCLKIIDDRILEIDFLADNLRNPLATLKNGKSVALLRMGHGIHRVLTMLLALSTCKEGIILIDEIENGLHYSIQEELWNLIFEIATAQNIQVFATTQSMDAVKAFGKIVNNDDGKPLDGRLIKLENIEGIIEPLTFDPDELKVITGNSIEVRR
jgi:AAA15 family ATPase/GTPase